MSLFVQIEDRIQFNLAASTKTNVVDSQIARKRTLFGTQYNSYYVHLFVL